MLSALPHDIVAKFMETLNSMNLSSVFYLPKQTEKFFEIFPCFSGIDVLEEHVTENCSNDKRVTGMRNLTTYLLPDKKAFEAGLQLILSHNNDAS